MDNRFDRHALIADWDQYKLKNATVIIVGIGALGNEVARILAMSGVGHLMLCDPDIVSLSNLSRCVLFREKDIGRLKVEAAKEVLADIAPYTKVQTRALPLVHGVGLAELRDASLIFSCLDSRTARLQLAGRCNLVKAPYIDGGTQPWGGEVRPFLETDGACYACTLSEAQRAISDIPQSCLEVTEETGSTVSSSVLVGAWMSLLGIRFLMNLSCPNHIIRIEGSQSTSHLIQQQRDPTCPLHVPIHKTTVIPLHHQNTLSTLLKVIGHDKTILLWETVQEKVECQQCEFEEIRWGLPKIAYCPQCGDILHSHTTLDLRHAPPHFRLSEFGIAPREILTIKHAKGLDWVELSDTGEIL